MSQTILLDVLNNLFIVCIVLAVAFLILSVVLFFLLDIRSSLRELSGKARAADMKKMRENYAFTGSLLQSDSPIPAVATAAQKAQRQSNSGGLFMTERLREGDGTAGPDAKGTALLQKDGAAKPQTEGVFRIHKQFLVVHTEETIR